MFSLLKKLMRKDKVSRDTVTASEFVDIDAPKNDTELYSQEKAIAQKGEKSNRLSLAQSNETHKEILYFMAENDPDPDVRKAVAGNEAAPIHVSTVLARDTDVDVRMALGNRLCALLPDISEDQASQIYAFAVKALGTLALDEVIKIRKALASALKDSAHAPPRVAGQLARDIEREVSEPILRLCTALSDDDLVDILKNHPQDWAAQAIACRAEVSATVSDAVIETDNQPAGKKLLENEGAEIAKDTVRKIIDKAKEYQDWQEPIALNKNLPADLACELALFASETVKELLAARDDFDEDVKMSVVDTFYRRLNFVDRKSSAKEATAMDRVKAIQKEGGVMEEVISDALGMRDTDFVFAALAKMAKIPDSTVKRIFSLKAAKPIVAICWKAGISMRLALQLQKELGHVQPKELIYAREGDKYPFSEEEMNWQLEFLGIKKG